MGGNIIDARQLPSGAVVESDLCIVGAGAAGITLAKEFANLGLKLSLLESGGLNFDQQVQSQGDVESVGRPYPPGSGSRLRYFGGTTNHWGGHCVPLEPSDFEARPWISDVAWPIRYEDVLPYYEKAVDVLQIGEFNYNADEVAKQAGLTLIPFRDNRVQSVVSRYNRMRFGLQFYDELTSAENVQVFLHASASTLLLQENQAAVVEILAKTSNQDTVRFRAKYFVLAAGGIENPLLLLASKDQAPKGVGNDNDLVGRYFMDHLWYPSGIFLTPDGVPPYNAYLDHSQTTGGIDVRFHLAVSAQATQELRIPKFRAEISRVSLVNHEARRVLHKKWSREVLHAIADLVKHPLAVADRAFDKNPAPLVYALTNYVEQAPNFNSRITLSPSLNSLGNPLPRLDWRVSPIDKEGITKSHALIGRELGRARLGRFRLEMGEDEGLLLDGVTGGCHHMGTTRMSDSPRDGVVDKNSKIHGIDNVYVAGSSVFPTVGWANPTMTIVALTLRLADHLRSRFGKEA